MNNLETYFDENEKLERVSKGILGKESKRVVARLD